MTLVRRVAEDQGLLPELAWRDDGLHVTVHNCAFRELSGTDPELVCGMHRSFLEGVVEVVMAGLGPVTFCGRREVDQLWRRLLRAGVRPGAPSSGG